MDYPNLLQFSIATLRHLTNAFFLGFLPLALFSGLAWLAAGFAKTEVGAASPGEAGAGQAVETRRLNWEERAFVAAFAALGTLIGIFMGASRVGVVGAILPAVITLVSGYLAYLFTRNSDIVNRHIVPACLLSLLFSASSGAFYGSSIRAISEANERTWEKELIEFKEIEIPLNRELLLRQIEESAEGKEEETEIGE